MLASLLILAKKPKVKLLFALTKRERAAGASPICSLNIA
uniref:PRP39-2 n=1 Tax=Arundo donax TaxID=35708 RepID=A0A0A9FZY2_ARUDO